MENPPCEDVFPIQDGDFPFHVDSFSAWKSAVSLTEISGSESRFRNETPLEELVGRRSDFLRELTAGTQKLPGTPSVPIFLGNFTPKTTNYCLKNSAFLGFPGCGFLNVSPFAVWSIFRFPPVRFLTGVPRWVVRLILLMARRIQHLGRAGT